MSFKLYRRLHKMGFSRRKLRGSWLHQWGGEHIFHKGLWSLEREAVALAMLFGFLVATSPLIGLHVLLAIVLCLIFRANIPVAFAIQWVTNIFTAPVFYSMAYALGCQILHKPQHHLKEIHGICGHIGQHILLRPGHATLLPGHTFWVNVLWPLTFGCTLIGLVTGAIGYILVMLFWRAKAAPAKT